MRPWPLVSRPEPGGYEYRLDLPRSSPSCWSMTTTGGCRSAPPPRWPSCGVAARGSSRCPDTRAIRLEHGPVPWTDLGQEGFAGVGAYAGQVDVDSAFLRDRRILAAFGDVGDIARVMVNGVDCGITWTAPFEADITGALRPGLNAVVVEVANAWMNRLIAEARHPTGEIFAPVADVYEPARRDLAVGPERPRRAPGLRPRPA